MKPAFLGVLALCVLLSAPSLHAQANAASMPSSEEINDLLGKAAEYVGQYQATFKNSKATLDKAPITGFIEKSDELCGHATTIIAALKKNGPSAFALVGLIAVLDDMSVNAARASAMAMIVGMEPQAGKDPNHSAPMDMQDLAQAEKNCVDISELILHSTLRLIAVEENILHTLSDGMKQKQ